MKSTLLSLAIGAVALVGFSTQAEAGPRFSAGYGYSTGHYSGHGHSHRQSNIHSYVGNQFRGHSNHCATPYRVRTEEVCRRSECRTAYTSCGRPYNYHVTIVTYRDVYSNGSVRTYTRTIS